MPAVVEEFFPSVQGGSLWFVNYLPLFTSAQVADSCYGGEGGCPTNYFPVNLIGLPLVFQVPDMPCQCCARSFFCVLEILFVAIVPLFEGICREAHVLLHIVVLSDSGLVDQLVHRALAGHWAFGRVLAVASWWSDTFVLI